MDNYGIKSGHYYYPRVLLLPSRSLFFRFKIQSGRSKIGDPAGITISPKGDNPKGDCPKVDSPKGDNP